MKKRPAKPAKKKVPPKAAPKAPPKREPKNMAWVLVDHEERLKKLEARALIRWAEEADARLKKLESQAVFLSPVAEVEAENPFADVDQPDHGRTGEYAPVEEKES